MTTNHLSSEVSPYLLQHQHNPVHWYPWSEEAFKKARDEDKPIFLSIGYATCYWCHMMEKDSFEHSEVAEVLNRSFVSIKVDREERPDVDQIYMDAVIGITGQGGWPMSVFLTPDKKPFFGGTFFPRAQFIKLLEHLALAWATERGAVLASASSITDSIKNRILDLPSTTVGDEVRTDACAQLLRSFDSEFGGFGPAPKFPPSQQCRLLLQTATRTGNVNFAETALFSLDAIARSALFDHLEGGFHRYATDRKWEVPHFEKMLYDNALLIPTYLDAFQHTGDERFAFVARRTAEYLVNRMQGAGGGFFSAEDAGDAGREGEFYIWKFDELKEALPPVDFDALCRLFTISEDGNFEGHNTLCARDLDALRSPEALEVLHRLRVVRDRRERPLLDDKVLTSWNGIAIGALARAARVLGDANFEASAVRAATFIRSALYEDRLLHRYRAGVASISGLLEDYVFLIQGLIELYQASFDESWLTFARKLHEEQDSLLWDASSFLYRSSANTDIPFPKTEIIDGAIPSPNSIAASNLRALGALFGDLAFLDRAKALEGAVGAAASRYPTAFCAFLQTADFDPVTLYAVTDTPREAFSGLRTRYFPGVLFVAGTPQGTVLPTLAARPSGTGQTTYFRCQGQVCTHSGSLDEVMGDSRDNKGARSV